MFIDENGKLFGKINLIDAFIVLIIIAALAFGGWYFVRNGGGDDRKLTIQYTIESVQKEPEYFDYIIPGESVVDGQTKQPMGKIVDFTTKPSRILSQDNETMSLVYDEIEGMVDGYIVVELDADVDYPDLKSGDEEIKLGKLVAYRSESAAIHGYIIDIDYDRDRLEEMK